MTMATQKSDGVMDTIESTRAAYIGQATAVEQSRAIAEVQGAIVVAQQCPRDVQRALADAKVSCSHPKMAERAFYSFPRGKDEQGKTNNVTGPSVYLARELARCWGNVQYGLSEMRRDDIAGESEMMVWAWDVQTNARSQHTFIVKHARDRKDRVTRKNVRDPLIELRDIYENNANHGARRLREAIMAILPTWFVEEAKDTCWATLKKGDGKPLPLRISKAVEYFDQVHGVSIKRLETKVGRARSEWSEFDVAQLMVTAKTLDRRETTLDEAFPEENVPVNILPNGQPAMASPISVTHPIPIPGVAGFQPDYVIPASRLKVYDKDGNPLEEQPAETAAEPTESAEPHTPTDEAPPEAPAQDGEAGWPTVTKPGTGRKRS